MTETDGEKTEATETAGAVDKVALWDASRYGAEVLGPDAGWLLRAMCWICSEKGQVFLSSGGAAPLLTAEETQEALRKVQEAGYIIDSMSHSGDEDCPEGGTIYVLNAAKILSDPPPPECPKGKVGYKIDFEKIFGRPLVKREEM